ncbi:MAG: sigma-70 family RNA polymerase sigma factor [Bacteroidales bacterium]|nr:sigma-70 family RNA polymerase sigma factor [Candidatus Physcousia equi]
MLDDEKELIRQLHNEDTRRDAFECLVRAHQQKLYYMVRRIVVVHEDTDDVIQNTFVKAWQAIEHFRGESSLLTWLYRIAAHEALDHLARQRRKAELSIDRERESDGMLLADRLESDPYFDGDETERQLMQAIDELPEKQRVVFHLKYFEEMKYEQMSEVLGTSVGALKASYHHAVKKISAFFGMKD